ncbi:ribulose-phosphate 3-epimerase [Spirochaetes bacterium]|uniref:Ribulose-phosphate 3-epimerase n=1 Tax=Candidatus Scatousia excrementipullorum TaxID=2840936 RepID=A0A9D9DNM8_9BACT|nr:ribulose-phosphate 3-epimerase [Candidatus Scatousia excrementipullorum]
MKKVIISPSILSADFANLERDIKLVENAGADWLHVDIMDGHFVPNITIGVPVVKSIKKITNLPLDVHLMIENPDKYIQPFAAAGADIITFHYEAANEKSFDIIKQIQSAGLKAGISIKPKTHPETIKDFLDIADMVLVMTVEPGFGGQKFMSNCADKIPYIRENSTENLIIQVDGGINADTAKICIEKGANSLVAGNYVYKSADINAAIQSLR